MNRIRQLREERDMRQYELAERLGVTKAPPSTSGKMGRDTLPSRT